MNGFVEKSVQAEVRVLSTETAERSLAVVTAPSYRQSVRAIPSSGEANLGRVVLAPQIPHLADFGPQPPFEVLTVCEALESRDRVDFTPVVIVGIFKSGLDETLRQDCPDQLVTGDIGFMSAIALTRPTDPPESLRAEVEKKRAVILASGPPGAHPRPERVVALYGRLVSPSGLTTVPCCTAPVEINAAPARLLGLDERDFRVLR